MAKEIDEKLNASFGQTNSIHQHVYRVSLCKGTPYYGYHSNEHLFLRIELYNPNLIKRTANLLQSGSIMGKKFQPHESHIPYVLKFFIDYNLFGMSYLHVPLEKVHTRCVDDSKLRKRAVSQLEVDFKACFILNRAALVNMDDKAANAGIESIWEDERKRRLDNFIDEALELKVPDEEERICLPTNSEAFFKNVLMNGLNLNTANNSIYSCTTNDLHKKKFELKNFLDTSTHAAEYTQNSDSSQSIFNFNKSSSSCIDTINSQSIDELEKFFYNSIESNVKDEINQKKNFDIDSILAPLSVEITDDCIDNIPTPTKLDQNEEGGEEENEFNLTVADLEGVFLNDIDKKDEFTESIPQFDGIDDKIEIKQEKLSPSQLTYQIDCERNFHPVAGTSRFKKEIFFNSSTIQNNLKILAIQMCDSDDTIGDVKKEKNENSYDDDDNDQLMKFCDQSLYFNDFESSNDGDESVDNFITENVNCIVTPMREPPHPSTVLCNLLNFDISSTINPHAFFSNPSDITGKKEVGHNMLEIPGNKLNDCEEFKSSLYDCNLMEFYQNLSLKQNFGFHLIQNKTVHELKNDELKIVVHPIENSPTYADAKNWIMSFSMKKEEEKHDELESPVKMKREKTINVLQLIDEGDNSEDFDKTLVPTTTPQTSSKNQTIENSNEKQSLSEYKDDDITLSYSARKAKKRRKMRSNFSKKFREIMKAKISSSTENLYSPQSSTVSDSSEDYKKENSQDSSDKTFDSSFIVNANTPEGINSNDYSQDFMSNTYGFKLQLESLQSSDEHTDLTILSMELHVQTKGDFKPNPETDPICAIFYSLEGYYVNGVAMCRNGIIAVNDENLGYFERNDVTIQFAQNEQELLEMFFHKVRLYDPDIFASYELELQSWGYLIDRGCALNLNFSNALSRMPLEKEQIKKEQQLQDEEATNNDQGEYFTELKIHGRILLDVWRLLRYEIALTSYTFENICYHILHRRYPKHSYKTLTEMWSNSKKRWIVLDYYVTRAKVLLEILSQLDLIGRTSELAKLFGIQFFEVLSRGSQFRVESMMLRIVKRRNYIAVSPSVQQRVHMRSPEYIPLILEPESRFYTDPVIVLDFQSLYPSIIIAYNYCFSTCLGRVENLSKGLNHPFEFGAYQLKISPTRLQYFLKNDLITYSTCGVAFIKKSVKEGVLPRMLKEILDTRLMVKQSMKLYKNNNALQRILHSRQLGLKLIANVTYGYTAANFSGRMPAIEVGDSVVSKGRETLERAISMVEKNDKWRVKVCYGDTDSIFVLCPGRTREEAFKIGEEIAEAVTNENPFPVKLKLEKVYQPCILQTKKRYVGNMYENNAQSEPIFEAKGIETIRRDGCPMTSKMLEKSLKILFESYDVSKVKQYVCRQFTKLLEGRSSIQDLIIAKEFRGISGYKEKACVPALTLTRYFF